MGGRLRQRRAARPGGGLAGLVVLPIAAALLAFTPLRSPATAQPTEGVPLTEAVPPERIWRRDCAHCHGDDARGTRRAPSLVGTGRAYVDYMLRTGRMPPRQDPTVFTGSRRREAELERSDPTYPPETIEALVAYVGSLIGPTGPDIPSIDPSEGDLVLGGELYRLECAACHAWSARGGALLLRAAPTLQHSEPIVVAEAIRVGPGTMPEFPEGLIDDHELNSLVAYVDYLRSPRDPGGHPLAHKGPLVEGAVAWVVGLGVLALVLRWIGTVRGAS